MANILLTQRCVRSCPYCFAGKHMADSDPSDMLSWANLIYLADFFEASGERHISLLGGEPTLHPLFADFLLYLLARGFEISIFTSGIMARETLDKLSAALDSIPPEKVRFICNLNDPQKTPASPMEVDCLTHFLQRFGRQTGAGFNIYRPDFDMEFLFRMINEYGMLRTLRLGLAHPIPGKKNLFIDIKEMPLVIERLRYYAPLMERLRIRPGLDCGFPLCLFSDEHLGQLYRFVGEGARFGCGAAIDIGPDMAVWSCFPLSEFHKRSIFEFNNLQEIRQFYREKIEVIRAEAGGIFEKCDLCLFREDGRCSGGCVAHLLSVFRDEARVRFPEVYV